MAYQEGTVLRNLSVLKQLVKGKAPLAKIVQASKYRQHPVERSLQQLIAQGLVTEKDGALILKPQHR